MQLMDQQREMTGQLIDGIQQIQQKLAKPQSAREPLHEMVMAGRGKPKRLAVRR